MLAINIAWWSPDDAELLRRIVATVETTFPSVYVVTGISDKSGAVLLAGWEDASPDNIPSAAQAVRHEELAKIAREACAEGFPRISVMAGQGEPLTDDRAPVDKIAYRLYRQVRQEKYHIERQVVSLSLIHI